MNTPLTDTLMVARPPIQPSNFSKPFWEATRERRLLVQFCPASGKYQFFPRPVSVFTGRRALEWREVSGHGSLYSYTVAELGSAAFRDHTPYVVGLVELDEGVRLISNLVGVTRETLRIGMQLIPYWAPLADGMHLPLFQPEARKA